MSGLIFHCKTCGIKKYLDVDVNINYFAETFKHHHQGHSIDLNFKNDMEAKYKTRPMIRYLSYHHPNDMLVGAEIGTKYGDNAYNIFLALKIKKLYLIDPYDDDYKGYDKSDFTEETANNAYKIANKLLEKFKNKVFIRKLSEDAVNDIPHELDFVYIDGNHAYEYVMKDLELYYPKLKLGGVIGGHDFGLYRKDVIKAVIDFIEKHDMKIYENKNTDFWIIKEKEI